LVWFRFGRERGTGRGEGRSRSREGGTKEKDEEIVVTVGEISYSEQTLGLLINRRSERVL